LFHREKTGEGQFIDIALLDSIMPLMGWVAANLLIGNQQPSLLGNDNFTAAPSGTFATGDGYINIAANKQEQWESLSDALGLAELKLDARFRQRDARKKNRKLLTPLIEAKLKEHETAYWVELLNSRNIPSGAILGLEQALNQEQVRHRQTLKTIREEGIGELKLFNLTAKFEKTPASLDIPPPRLSAHTNEILSGLGYSEEQMAALRKAGAI
jgi:formyl-CoA transferase